MLKKPSESIRKAENEHQYNNTHTMKYHLTVLTAAFFLFLPCFFVFVGAQSTDPKVVWGCIVGAILSFIALYKLQSIVLRMR